MKFTVNPNLEVEIRRHSREALHEVTEAIADDARRLVPVDTGALREGISTSYDGDDAGYVVSERAGDETKVPIYVEFGTSTMDAQPYMRPAVYRKRTPRV